MNYKRKLRISFLYFLLMSSILFVYDNWFADRWEWPTWILLPYMMFAAIICIIPGILILNLTLRNIYLYHAVSLLLYAAAGFSSYMMRNITAIPECLKIYSNELLCVLALFWVYSIVISAMGCFAEIYLKKKNSE